MKTWKNVELKCDDAKRFRSFLRESEIKFETSGSKYKYTHFEVYVDNSEADACNIFLEEL